MTLNPRPKTLEPRPWTQDPGPKTLDPGQEKCDIITIAKTYEIYEEMLASFGISFLHAFQFIIIMNVMSYQSLTRGSEKFVIPST